MKHVVMRRGLAIATMALASKCAGHSSRELFISDCSGLERLHTNPMTEDLNLFIEDGLGTLTCNLITTVTLSGPHTLRLRSNARKLLLNNVRFLVKDRAHFLLDLPSEDDESEEITDGFVTFMGINDQASDGGVFHVEEGGTATFSIPVSFEGNSVSTGRSGGALSIDGTVTFEHAAHFIANEIAGGGDKHSRTLPCGGAVHVGKSGRVTFQEFASFEDNWAGNGGQGGAICNHGQARFGRRSFFTGNEARERHQRGGGGGQGGALFTVGGSQTTFVRKSIMVRNAAASSGGGVHNMGETTFETAAVFRGNNAAASVKTIGGGHVYNEGVLTVRGDVTFREGATRGHGGAAYIREGGVTILKGIVILDDNIAGGMCDNVYSDTLEVDHRLNTVGGGSGTRVRRRTSTAATAAAASPSSNPCLP